ncbi:aspartate/glutamate racemase family protein [Nonomuraea sp. NPDC046802]|uniref:aspartate/glutamate racemase family protein n=1 Tax=Nonomuraea sp. NPDC046802 TaxID=3154919 RepID=UPI003403ACA4
MRVLRFQKHVHPDASAFLNKMYVEHAAMVTAGSETTIEFHGLPPGTYEGTLPEHLVGYGEIRQLFGDFFAASAAAAERDGCDAWISGAGQDPGLVAARARAGIPVVGYGETVWQRARAEGQRLGVIGFIPELQEPICANIRAVGADVALYQVIDDGPAVVERALAEDFEPFLRAYGAAAVRAAVAGADWVVPAEGIPNELLVHLGIHDLAGFDLDHIQAEVEASRMLASLDVDDLVGWLAERCVIDPGGMAIATAEHLCRLRARPIGASPRRRRPPRAVIEHVERALDVCGAGR